MFPAVNKMASYPRGWLTFIRSKQEEGNHDNAIGAH